MIALAIRPIRPRAVSNAITPRPTANLVRPPVLVVLGLPVVTPEHTEQISHGPLTFKESMAISPISVPLSIHGRDSASTRGPAFGREFAEDLRNRGARCAHQSDSTIARVAGGLQLDIKQSAEAVSHALGDRSMSGGVRARATSNRKRNWWLQRIYAAVNQQHPSCGDLPLPQRSVGQGVELVRGVVVGKKAARRKKAIVLSSDAQDGHGS